MDCNFSAPEVIQEKLDLILWSCTQHIIVSGRIDLGNLLKSLEAVPGDGSQAPPIVAAGATHCIIRM